MAPTHHLQAYQELTHAAHDASTRNDILCAETLYDALNLIELCMTYDDYQAAVAWHREVFLSPAT